MDRIVFLSFARSGRRARSASATAIVASGQTESKCAYLQPTVTKILERLDIGVHAWLVWVS